jgi:hypothetical protein
MFYPPHILEKVNSKINKDKRVKRIKRQEIDAKDSLESMEEEEKRGLEKVKQSLRVFFNRPAARLRKGWKGTKAFKSREERADNMEFKQEENTMKYYLTQTGVKFIQEGKVKAKNKAKKNKWVKKIGIKKIIDDPTKPPSYGETMSSRKAARYGKGPASPLVMGREGLAPDK